MSSSVAQLEAIKGRIEEAKSQKARAEGAIERIEQQWEDDFDIPDGDTKAVKAKLEELDKSVKRDEVRLEALLEELDEATDWEEE